MLNIDSGQKEENMFKEGSQTERRTSRIRSVVTCTALGLLAAGCANTYRGGGVVMSQCAETTTDVALKNGDEIFVGVGDISFKSGSQDRLKLWVEDGKLRGDFPSEEDTDTDNEHLDFDSVQNNPETGEQSFRIFERGATMDLSSEHEANGVLVHMVKHCTSK